MPSAPPLNFARYREIASAVADRLLAGRSSDPLRPWTEEVIVASGGMAGAIATEVLSRVPAGVAGLQLQTLETLATRILNDTGEYPRIASEAERRLAMRMATRAVDDPMMESRGVASMLERSYRDARDGGLTLNELRPRARKARTQVVLRAWSEYERLIAAMEAVDPAELFRRAAAAVRAGGLGVAGEGAGATLSPQIVAGFYDMTGVQFELIEALRAAGKIAMVLVPTDEAFAMPFVEKFGSRGSELGPREPRVSIASYETREHEIRATCAAIAKLLEDGERSIGVVMRSVDPYDARLFQRVAGEQGFQFALGEETPLIAQRIGRGVKTLLRLREDGFPRHAILELVRDGLRTGARIRVDDADFETRKARIAGGPSEDLRRIRRRPPVVDDYIALVAELESLTSATPARGREWSETLQKIASMFRVETQDDLDALAAIDKVAELFRLADRTNSRFDAAMVLDALESSMLQTRSSGVWLGDVMKFRGRSFEQLFAVRMQDDAFPQRRTEDPLVPDADRRILGMREIGDGRAEEALLFQLLFDGASELHFSFAASDGFGKLLRPSQLLKNFATRQHPDAKHDILKNFAEWCATPDTQPPTTNHPPPTVRQLQLLAKSGTRSVFDGLIAEPALLPHFRRVLESVSPTQLEDFGECPQKFLLKHVLKVVDIDDPERELQIHHREKGSLDHRILEGFYRSLTFDDLDEAASALPRLPAALTARLEEAIDRAFDELAETAPPYNANIREIERRATKRILRDFVANDFADLVARGLFPKHFEYRFGAKYRERDRGADHPEPFVVEAAGLPIRVEGQIDRIDVSLDHYRIVDYKSGKALRHNNLDAKIDRGVRLQLALYAMAVAEFFNVDANAVSGTIKPLVIGEGKPKFAFALAEKRDGLQETLDLFVSAIVRGLFPAFPNEKDEEFNSCKYCPATAACRTKHDADERYAVTQWKDPRTLLKEWLAT